MPPRRSAAFIALFLLFFGFWLPQALASLAAPAMAETILPFAQAPDLTSPDELPIQLAASHDGPKPIGALVTFTATVTSGDATGLTYVWHFGDGQTQPGRVVQHSYGQPGNYSVFVIASRNNDSKLATTMVAIVAVPPTATPRPVPVGGLQATSSAPTIAGNPTTFLATIAQGTHVSYGWDFGDGTTATGPSVSHVYQTPGSYLVTVTADNDYGPAQSTTLQVAIQDAPPKGLHIDYATPLLLSNLNPFTATVESGTNVQYQWSISDGTIYRGPVINHLFRTLGTHVIRVEASNSAGTIYATAVVAVQDQPPTITQLFDDGPKPPGQPINFLALVESNSAISIQWHWGNGEPVTTAAREVGGTTVQQLQETYTYHQPGKYIVSLVVANANGLSYREFIVYVGTNKPPPQALRLTIAQAIPLRAHPITMRLDLDSQRFTCQWTLGDGGTAVAPPTIQYTYQQSGAYIVSASCTAEGQAPVEVDTIVHIGEQFFLPVLLVNRSFGPTGVPGSGGDTSILPTPTVMELPSEQPSATPTATATEMPPAAPTATATALSGTIPQATPTELPPAAPTATATALSGTIPQATPTPTDAPGGTVPQP
ncbi:MAG: PKD domain-containing protein [Caldilineaceae bacterium]|nr:PKD domain-containing protein [Caldilineaceae bacterium]